MKKLIIDTFGLLEGYERLEGVLEFYPYGLKGFIVDYLALYLQGPPVFHDTDQQDHHFFEMVLQRYYDSPEYRLHALNPDTQEQVLLGVFMGIGNIVRRIVASSEKELRQSVLDVNLMAWGPNYMLLDMHP